MTHYFNELIAFLNANPLLWGFASMGGLVGLRYLIQFIPTVYRFMFNQLTTSVTLNNTGWGMNAYQFTAFMEWFSKTKWIKMSRHLSMTSEGIDSNSKDKTYVLGAGYGTHFFFYKGKFYWFTKSTLESNGSEKQKEELTIKTFGRNQLPLFDLISDFSYKQRPNEISIYKFKKDFWSVLSPITKRNLNTVILDEETKSSILNNVDYFFSNEKWYVDRGLNYKQTYVLYGEPGTGKTSIIKAIASHYNRNVCVLNLHAIGSEEFTNAVHSMPKNSILLIEDFDSCKSTFSRANKNSTANNPPTLNTSEEIMSDLGSSITLSDILNTLDGIVSLNNILIFLTTNHLEKIDPALLRKGRVDYIYQIKKLTDSEIKKYIAFIYPDKPTPTQTFAPILGCDIQSLFLEHKENYDNFIKNLPCL